MRAEANALDIPEEATTILDAGLDYAARGLSVVPLRPGERTPLLRSWRPFQKRRASAELTREWWRRWPEANVGIVTGAVSRCIVLDGGGPEGFWNLMKLVNAPEWSWVSETAHGCHHWLQHPGGHIPTRAGHLPHLDVRADGGCVAAPPSVHPSGKRYQWHVPPSLCELGAMRKPVYSRLVAAPRPSRAGMPIEKGMRNSALYRLGRFLRTKGVEVEAIEAALHAENRARCRPPLGESEVRHIAAHVARQADRKDCTAPEAAAAGIREYTQRPWTASGNWPWLGV